MMRKIRAALLHLALNRGPQEENLKKLVRAIRTAAECGAQYIVTPEMAVQGYSFMRAASDTEIEIQPAKCLRPIQKLAKDYGLVIFLGCAEKDKETGNYHNSCIVICSEGEILGRHRKMRNPGGPSESWAMVGTEIQAVDCGDVRVGILICADSYFPEYAKELGKQKVDLLVVLCAWPSDAHQGPGRSWENCSLFAKAPVWVCNQTGKGIGIDFASADSALIYEGQKVYSYRGEEAILLFDWEDGVKEVCVLKKGAF